MKNLALLWALWSCLCFAPFAVRADESADNLRAARLAAIETQTARIAELRQEYSAFGVGTLSDDQKKERDGVRSELYFALLLRGQACEFTGQTELARVDYDAAQHHGFYHNVDSRNKVDMTQLYLGQARISLLQKRWSDAATHAFSAGHENPDAMWKTEALELESRANLYQNYFDTSQTRAEQMLGAAREANNASKQAVALRRVGAVLFLRGDLEGARAKWKQGSTFDGRLANIDPFDPNQIALNAALAKDENDLEARWKRARYFNERAAILEGKTPPAQNLANDFLDGVLTGDQAAPLPQTKPYQGGWSSVIELRSPTPETLRQDAIFDADFALNTVAKKPSPFRAALHLERARARRGLSPATGAPAKESLLQVSDDYLEAQQLAPTDLEIALEAGKFFVEREAPNQAMRFFSLVLARSSRPDASLLKQRDAIFAAFSKKPIEHPATLKTALDWKNRGNELSETDPLNALECYRKAVQLDPKFADGWNNIASIYARFDLLDLQRGALNRALQIDPKHRVAYANRAALHSQLGDFSSALDDAEKAVQFATTPAFRANALIKRAEAKAGLQKTLGAIEDFDAALEIEPENATAWALKGMVELRAARFGLAQSALEKAAEFAPHAQIWAALALARGMNSTSTPMQAGSHSKAAWDNAVKTGTRTDWAQTLRLIVELYQSGAAFQTYPATVFYREAFAAKNKFAP